MKRKKRNFGYATTSLSLSLLSCVLLALGDRNIFPLVPGEAWIVLLFCDTEHFVDYALM